MTSEGSGEIERLWQYTKRIVGFTEHRSITSSTLVHSEFEESEDNLLTLVPFNPIRSWVNPKIYWHLSYQSSFFLPKTTSTLKLSQGDLLVEREHIIAANSSFNMCKKKWIIILFYILIIGTYLVNNCIIDHSSLQPHQYCQWCQYLPDEPSIFLA